MDNSEGGARDLSTDRPGADPRLPERMSVPEAVVLMLSSTPGRLEVEWNMPGLAALIELVLAGRLGSVADKGFFSEKSARKLFVADQTPTGNAALDSALEAIAASGKPVKAFKALTMVRSAVSIAVYRELERGGIVEIVGNLPNRGHLRIVDDAAWRLQRDSLALIRSHPEAVTDPRTGAFIDVLRNGAPAYTGETGLHPRIRWEWYPADTRDAIDSILFAARVAFTSD